MPGYIHHIEWCVSDLQNQVQKLVSQYGFQPIGQRIRKVQNILDKAIQTGLPMIALFPYTNQNKKNRSLLD